MDIPESRPRDICDIEEAAEHLRTTRRHVRTLIAERQLAFIKVGNKVRFDRHDLDAYLQARRVEASK